VFDGVAVLDGLTARRVENPAELRRVLTAGAPLPVAVWAFAEILRAADWAAVIDARMRKRAVPEGQRGLAPLTIGLGPNFIAGENVDVAIETSWGRQPRCGDRSRIDAAAWRRAPADRRNWTGPLRLCARCRPLRDKRPDRRSRRGKCRRCDNRRHSVYAPISGVLRGLTRSGVEVTLRKKVIEVDMRGDPAAAFGLGERPRRIAEGVLKALARLRVAESV